MNKIFTDKDRDILMTELQRLEDFCMEDEKLSSSYFPHTLYELDCVLAVAV